MKKTLKNILFGLGSLALFATPYYKETEFPIEKKYSTPERFFSSKDFMECISIIDGIKYIPDSVAYGFNYWQDPFETIKKRTGNCDDKTLLLHYLLKQKGANASVFTCVLSPSHNKAHLANLIKFGEESFVIDPSSRVIIGKDTLEITKVLNSDLISRNIYAPLSGKSYRNIKRNQVRDYNQRSVNKIFISNSFR